MLGPLRARFSNLTSGTFSKKEQPSDPRIYGNSQGILGGLPKYKDQVKCFFFLLRSFHMPFSNLEVLSCASTKLVFRKGLFLCPRLLGVLVYNSHDARVSISFPSVHSLLKPASKPQNLNPTCASGSAFLSPPSWIRSPSGS